MIINYMYSVVDIDKYFSSKSTYLSHVYNIQLSTYVYISFLYLPRYIYIFQLFCNVGNSDVKTKSTSCKMDWKVSLPSNNYNACRKMRVLEERETWTLLTVAGCCLSVDM